MNLQAIEKHAAQIGVTLTHPDEILDMRAKLDHAKVWRPAPREDLAAALLDAAPDKWDGIAKKWAAQGEITESSALRRALLHQANERINAAVKAHADDYLEQLAPVVDQHIDALEALPESVPDLDAHEAAVQFGHGDALLAAQRASVALSAFMDIAAELAGGRRHISAVVTPPANFRQRPYTGANIDSRFLNLASPDDLAVHTEGIRLQQATPDWLALARHPLGFELDPAQSLREIADRYRDWIDRSLERAVTDRDEVKLLIVAAKPDPAIMNH